MGRRLSSADVQILSLLVILAFIFGPLGWLALGSRQLRRQGYRNERLPPSINPEHAFDPSQTYRVRCGARIGRRNATVPLVTLRVDERWAQISVGGSLSFFGGPTPVWIDRSVVAAVRRVHVAFSPGIRFVTVDGRYDGVVLWTYKPEALLDSFRDRDWPVADVGVLDPR